MNIIARWGGAITLSVAALIYPQESTADGFTGEDFAGWSAASQDNYIQTSVTMAGVVLTQLRPEVSTCIDDWYFAGESLPNRNDQVRRVILENRDYHPSGVILAIIVQACGPLNAGG